MERSVSGASFGSGSGTLVTPPWEQRSIAQVPYVAASSPALSDAERNALPDLWATRLHMPSRQDSLPTSARSLPTTHSVALSTKKDSWVRPWKEVTSQPATPAPVTTHAPAPYETQLYSTNNKVRQLSPSPPTKNIATEVPPTPPDSLLESPSSDAGVTALPGTMSSRTAVPKRRKAVAPKQDHQRTRSVTLARRCKKALKGAFSRAPVDESQYVHLKDRHWTEDY
ncbi:hypothetical protein LTR56_019990 [Elasticomyces elasticus]|nr:hypothetical protein LTR56_019990 [Elasticomyces elasticus]KAK3634099.1 hypothetical protein LTR22_019831 [Elasticomyces elasticus]KAK4911184.1 hypothetical protein LTR49_020256 [Elasticomyces elasticus]KAK5748021.1 hypothetical protein LTS12_021950 [Elasticomyces elasticus]